MDYGIIYLIKNNIDSRQYVGKTIQSLDSRWKAHKSLVKRGSSNQYIHRAMNFHGIENFSVEKLDVGKDKLDLCEKEIMWIEKLKTLSPDGYNISKGGDGGSEKGRKAWNKGKKVPQYSGPKHHFYGKKWCEERRKKIMDKLHNENFKKKMAPIRSEAIKRLQKYHLDNPKIHTLISPSGEKILVTNLKKWCEEFPASVSTLLNKKSSGPIKSGPLKGWNIIF